MMAHKASYGVVVEQVIVELLDISGADKLPGDNLMENLQQLNGEMHRHIITPHYNEFITLAFGEVITHVAHIFVEGDNIGHIILTADEMREAQNGETN